MAYIKITDRLKKRGQKAPNLVEANRENAENAKSAQASGVGTPGNIKVCIGSCSHCAKLRDSVLAAADTLGIDAEEIDVVTDLARLMRMGIMTTPALIIGGRLVSMGKVLTPEQCITLLRANGYEK